MKRTADRSKRIAEFQRTGRIISVRTEENRAILPSGPTMLPQDASAGIEPRKKGRSVIEYLLLGVEVIAALGLVFIFFSGMSVLRDLNNQARAALILPTLTPTPLVRAVVLPSGHTPPTSPGGARPNYAEIPEHLRPIVQQLENIPVPTPGPEQAIRIQIPALNIDAPVVQGDGWEQLKQGVGQHIGTANPGQNGNMVLSAHNDIFGELFRYLDQLAPGDEVTIYSNIRAYTYVITGTEIVEPTYVQAMDQTADPTISLISCYPYLIDTERIVVKGQLQNN